MPYDVFWHGPVEATIAYREAHEIKSERSDYDMWQMGAYVYNAAAAAVYNYPGFREAPKKPMEYLQKPLMFYRENPPRYYQDPDEKPADRDKSNQDKIKARDSEILKIWMNEMVREGNHRKEMKQLREPSEPVSISVREVSDDAEHD